MMTDVKATYRDALAVPEFRAIYISHIMSMLGTVMTDFALTVLIYSRTGSPLLSALVFALGLTPHLLVGSLLSALVDRLPIRGLLVGCNLVTAGAAMLMSVPGMPVAALLGLALCVGLVAPVFAGARIATLPDVLPGPAFVPARSLMRITAQCAVIFGLSTGGVLLSLVSPTTALLINAGCFLGSALILRLGTRDRRPSGPPERQNIVRDSLAGLRQVFRVRPLRRVLVLSWTIPAFAVFPEALAVPYAADLGLGSRGTGLLLAAVPVGVVLGESLAIWLVPTTARVRLIVPMAALVLAPLVVFALHPTLWAAVALLVLSSAGFAYHLGLDQLMLDMPSEELRPRALMIQSSGLMFWQGVGYVVAGGLALLASPAIAIVTAGVAGLVCVTFLRPSSPSP